VVEIRLTEEFRKAMNRLSVSGRQEVQTAMVLAARAWADPDRHSAIAIRDIRPGIYEARSGARLRLLFAKEPAGLDFFMFGDHRAVKDFICGRDHGSRASGQAER
jgi:hypothetical protein